MSTPSIARRSSACALLLALGTACADRVVAPPPAAPAAARHASAQAGTADVGGVWHYQEDATFVYYDYAGGPGAKTFRCSSTGTYTFVQTGETFTGSYDQVGTCTAADGESFPNDFTGVTVEGTVSGRHLRFDTADGCSYEATLRGPDLDEMVGAGKCGGGRFFGTYRATFTATR